MKTIFDNMYNSNYPKILQVNTADISGGAAKISYELHQAYQQLNLSSWLVVGYKQSTSDSIFEITPPPKYQTVGSRTSLFFANAVKPLIGRIKGIGKLYNLFSYLAEGHYALERELGIQNYHFPASRKITQISPKHPDIVHLHNLHGGYFDLRYLPTLSKMLPTAITLHDTWMISGACSYTLDCNRWLSGCGDCPYLDLLPSFKRDASAFNWKKKKNIFKRCELYITAPSQWVLDKANRSILNPAIKLQKVIPNSIDISVFKPLDKNEARNYLHLPLDKKILITVADRIKSNCWKDFDTFYEALHILSKTHPNDNILVLAVGEKANTEIFNNIEIHYLPFQKDNNTLAKYYQAADIYIHSAKIEAEAFGLTPLEARACGTPVIATAVGGVPEHIKDGETGFLVPPANPKAMASFISTLLMNDNQRIKMGKQAQLDARQNFGFDTMVSNYLEWYEEVIADYYQI